MNNTKSIVIAKYIGFIILILVLILISIIYFNQNSNLNSNSSNNPSPTASPTTLPSESESEKQIKIYLFSETKFNIPNNTDYLVNLERSSNRVDIGTFAIEGVIKGPTSEEMQSGNKVTNIIKFEGISNCNGKDFTLSIQNQIAELKLCRKIIKDGDILPFYVKEMFVKTLKQFPTVDKVKIYEEDGKCFDDTMSGIDFCAAGGE